MLHIILLILKIIGIIIMSIVGLLLLILLVCLFVPVVYRIQGAKHEQDIRGMGKVCWLCISAKASANSKDKQVDVKIRILGIPLEVFQRIGTAIGKLCKNVAKILPKKNSAVRTNLSNTKDSVDKNINQTVAEDNITKQIKDKVPKEIDKAEEAIDKKITAEEVTDKKRASEAPSKDKAGLWPRIKEVFIKVYYFPRWLYEKVRKIYLTISDFCVKIKRWKEFLTGDTFKRAFKFVMSRGNVLRKHTLPRKITGNIKYGFDDPSLTGQSLAVLSAIAPKYKGKFIVIPMFNQEILEGDILMRGHVFGFTLVRIAWSVYRNKDVKEVIHHFSQKEA